jgi:hypothetical protein
MTRINTDGEKGAKDAITAAKMNQNLFCRIFSFEAKPQRWEYLI